MKTFRVGKKAICTTLVFLLSVSFMFANSSTGALANALSIILGVLCSGYMKAILTIALIGLAIGLLFNRGQEGALKKFLPWIAACIIILSASQITGTIFSPSNQSGNNIAPSSSQFSF